MDSTDLSDALANARAIEGLMESEGWTVLMDRIADRLHKSQKAAMKKPIQSLEQANYERGVWGGLAKVEDIAQEIVNAGMTAKAELERRGA